MGQKYKPGMVASLNMPKVNRLRDSIGMFVPMKSRAFNRPTYGTWYHMLSRCLDPKDNGYTRYGACGISVCDRWLSFDNFVSDMGLKPAGLTLDRIKNSGNYEPSNCRWATPQQQAYNRRNNVLIEHNGKAMCIADWARELGVPLARIRSRYMRRWSVERMLSV